MYTYGHARMIIVRFFERFFSMVSSFISPPYCITCKKLLSTYRVMCQACFDALPVLAPHREKVGASCIVTVYAFTRYQEPFDALIQAKLRNNPIPIFQAATLLYTYTKTLTLNHDIIVPIPLHWQRRLGRGFNQADILAAHVGEALDKPILRALKRHKKTTFQLGLSPELRKKNVHHAFTVVSGSAALCKNKRILLVDDVYTTGATAAAAARELYTLGALAVDILVVCRV